MSVQLPGHGLLVFLPGLSGRRPPLRPPADHVGIGMAPLAQPVLEPGWQHSGIGSGIWSAEAGPTTRATISASVGRNGDWGRHRRLQTGRARSHGAAPP